MRVRTFVSVAVISALGFLTPMQSYAFGLGKIELSSALNEPFKASIPVTALRDDDGNLRVKLASNVEFEKAGLQRTFLLTQLNFEVVEDAGETSILINSSQPVKEPFLDFLVTVATSNGRLIREYTVLLDPPKDVFIKAPVTQKSTPSRSTKTPSVPKSTYQYPAANSTSSYSSATSYTVGKDDTLWNIARDTKPESAISIHQMMMALLKANPSAFYNNNINSLKAGRTLDVPTANEIKQLSRAQAYAAVKEQNIEWKNRNREVAPIADMPAQENVVPSEENANDITATEQLAPLVKTDEENDARLKLVVPNNDSDIDTTELSPLGDSELVQLSDQLTLAQETIESQAQENIDLKSRMDMMEEQLQILRRLVTLEDPDLAKIQNTLQENQEELLETVEDELELVQEEPVEETVEDELDLVQEELAETVEDELVQEELVETVEGELEVEQEELIELVEENEVEQSGQSEVDAYFAQLESGEPENNELDFEETSTDDEFPLIPLDETSSEFDEMSDDTSTQLAVEDSTENSSASMLTKVKDFYARYKNESLIAGLVILVGLILLMVKARRKEEFEWEESSEEVASTSTTVGTMNDDHESTVAINKEEDIINDAYASLDHESGEKESTATLELEPELAAIIESESDSDATQAIILDEELEVPELNADLEQDETIILESAPESIEEFEIEKESELSEDELEFNLEGLSTDVEPENELDISELEDAKEEELLDFDLGISIDTDEKDEPSLELDSGNELSSDDIEFDGSLTLDIDDDNELTLDDEPLSLEIGSGLDDSPLELDGNDDSSDSLELDMNELDAELSPPDLELNDLDTDLMSLDIEEEEILAEPEIADLSIPVSSESELEFDLGNFDEIDEAETKLDLAGAYMDMGDPEGARSILEEVLNDGSDEQKEKAQSLLSGLS